MIILYVLVPLGLLLCALAVWAFFWAVNAGQFDDLERAGCGQPAGGRP
jgi:cbb3-type cytochrome oxidase maturation protein